MGFSRREWMAEEVPWEEVVERIQRIVEGEDKANPLSDDDIVQEMSKQGFRIARRTVKKYRKANRIPPPEDRRS